MTAAPPSNVPVQVVIVPVGGDAPRDAGLDPWLGLAAALVALGFAASAAARRRQPGDSPRRLVRIFAASALFGSTLTLWLVAEELRTSGPSGQLLPMAALAAAALTLVALVLFGVADFWLGLLAPVRSRRWLVAAILLFGLILSTALAIALGTRGAAGSLIDPGLMPMVVIAATAGIAWWSHLPTPRPDVSGRFE